MYFAKLNDSNIVMNVIMAEAEFIQTLPGRWIESDPNGVDPINPARMGDRYDEGNNAFISPRPYPSWSLGSNFQWQPPTPIPNDGNFYKWSEQKLDWVKVM